MHKLLERQLKRHFGDLAAVPKDLLPLLEAVSSSYAEADVDRRLVERSLELTSQELLQRNAALNEAYERLMKVDKERMQFINNAAHELGTPLTPVKLQLHLLRERLEASPSQSPDLVKHVEIMERNFARLHHLVRDLLDSARLQADMLKLNLQQVDLREIVYQAVETYLAPAREAKVRLEVDDMPPMPVVADPIRLGQVFDNLLSNAIKFSPVGSAIQVGAHEQGGFAFVTVRDHGAGIQPAGISRLFQPFSQVHDTMRSTKGGTGLGLFVSKGILEALDGGIAASSGGLGLGTTFTVRLPLAVAPAARRRTGAGNP